MSATSALRSRRIERLPLPFWLKLKLQQLRNVQTELQEWRQVCRQIAAWQKTQASSRPTVVIVGPKRIGKSHLARTLAEQGSYFHVSIDDVFVQKLWVTRIRGQTPGDLKNSAQQAVGLIKRLCRRFPRNLVIETGLAFAEVNSQPDEVCENSLRSILDDLNADIRGNGCKLCLALQADHGLHGRLSALRAYRESARCWTSDIYDEERLEEFAARSLRLQRLLRRACPGSIELLEIDPADFHRSIERIAASLVERAA
jgi:hypothetical protein